MNKIHIFFNHLNDSDSFSSTYFELANINKEKLNWINWFIGFCDGEVNFQTFPKKRSYLKKSGELSEYYNIGYGFHLSLSIKDKDLLLDIHTNLNNKGKIYEYTERNEIRLAITKLEDLNWLIFNIFERSCILLEDQKVEGVFLTEHQKERYLRFKLGILNKFNRLNNLLEYEEFLSKKNLSSILEYIKIKTNRLFHSNTELEEKTKEIHQNSLLESEIIVKKKQTNLDNSLDNWICGFITGEGCFNIKNNNLLVFYIEQSDKTVLNIIKKRFHFNTSVNFREKRFEGYKDTYSLSASSKKDIHTLISFFDRKIEGFENLKGNKLIQYKNWKIMK
jgi:LAGLIDADG endonuclease